MTLHEEMTAKVQAEAGVECTPSWSEPTLIPWCNVVRPCPLLGKSGRCNISGTRQDVCGVAITAMSTMLLRGILDR